MSHSRRRRRSVRWFVVALAVIVAVSCSGGSGCSGCGMETIPGGFSPAKRVANAGQVRVTSSGLAAITADPAALLGGLLGGGGGSNGTIAFPIVTCGSTAVCCEGTTAIPNCGPVDIDLSLHAGDLPRLELAPQNVASPNGQLNITVRARVKTANPLVIGLSGAECTLALDTTQGSAADIAITTQVALNQDGTAGTTTIAANNTAVTGLETADYTIAAKDPTNITDDIDCGLATFIPASLIESQLASPIASALGGATCKSCASGNVADCGSPFATACTGGTCIEGSACLQELGIDGRLPAASLFGSLSPGTTGALDLYEVAGGYSTTADTGATGISLGLLGGMEPGGSARDLCGPPATAPAPVSVPRSLFFEGNTRPDNGSAFDVGIGLHKSQLAQLAYAGYEGGLFCLTIGHGTVAQLTTDTIGLLSRSLTHLVETNSPMAIGLRPQSPPTITLGPNTFTTDGSGNRTLAMPLLDVKFTALELDFFAQVDDQYIRVFTVVSDVDLPVGIDVGMGTLTPVLGDTTNAFTNLSVKNADAVTESPATLAQLFPTLLGLVLPQLSAGLSPISLPSIGGLNLAVDGVTAVDDQDGDGVGDYLAIFAHLASGTAMMAAVHTTVDISAVDEPDPAIARDPARWQGARPPTVTLALGAIDHDARELEFSLRIDDGTWTPWSRNPNPTVSPRTFWLPGIHSIEVRARVAGALETVDPTPARISVPIGAGILPARATGGVLAADVDPFHGTTSGAGCQCNGGGSAGDAAPFALILALVLLPRRRLRAAVRRAIRRATRGALRLGPLVWTAAVACVPGCNCSNNPCGGTACMTGSLTGSVGRWTSIAGDDKRVMVATYDQVFGDLVIADATDASKIAYTTIDGVPPDTTPTYDPGTWRGGVSDPGPNVGAWTSIQLAGHVARVAYQDRDALALKYAYESNGGWQNYVVDAGHGEQVGVMTRMIIDNDGKPTIAYLAIGNDDGMGHRTTELRLARATSPDPQSTGDWTFSVIATGDGTCAGLCDGGEACVAGAAATDPQTCITPTTTCTPACGTGDVCNAGACATEVVDPMIDDIPTGTGLFVSLVVFPDGRLAASYYDRNARALVLAVESGKDTSQFAENILDGNTATADRGMWTSAAVASDGTVHIAYQDALGDEVMYTTWNNGTAGTPEVVDDGTRAGDRTHPVGAAAALWLVGGSPVVAYQDGLASDVDVATRTGTNMWSQVDLASGPLLDGFSIAVTTGHGAPVLAWDSLNPANTPPHTLVVKAP